MPPTPHLRRVAAMLMVAGLVVVPVLSGSGAAGTPIGDKKAEAARVADQLAKLSTQIEVYSEQYNDARLKMADADARVRDAQAQVARTQKDIVKRRREVARYAIGVYTGGGDDSFSLVMSSSGNDLPAREGYVSATVGNKADLVESLRAAEAVNQDRIDQLDRARHDAATVKARIDEKRKAADRAANEQQAIYSRVTGELKQLVTAEEARRAAAEAKRAQDAALRLAAQKRQAAPPAAPTTRGPSTGPTTTGPTTTNPPTGGGGPVSPPPPPAPTPGPGPTPPPPPPPPPIGQGADAAIAAAKSQLGVRYTWGGASPQTGFDCSGLTMWAWAHGGKSLPHSSAAQYSMSRKIPVSELQPGDLIFYGSPVHHVALYIGNGQIIHAPHRGSYVQIDSMYYWSDMAGAGRV
ncbi:MAG: hypothetical protein JWM05_686 [Acidimicrobiales bacterium]|nr:hypothetical protein [Acidimicrobiales bacterium]